MKKKLLTKLQFFSFLSFSIVCILIDLLFLFCVSEVSVSFVVYGGEAHLFLEFRAETKEMKSQQQNNTSYAHKGRERRELKVPILVRPNNTRGPFAWKMTVKFF